MRQRQPPRLLPPPEPESTIKIDPDAGEAFRAEDGGNGDIGEYDLLTGSIKAHPAGACQTPLSQVSQVAGEARGVGSRVGSPSSRVGSPSLSLVTSIAPGVTDASASLSASPSPLPPLPSRLGFTRRPGRHGEPRLPLPRFFKHLFRKPTRRQHSLAQRLEKYCFQIFGPERAVPILADLAAQRLLSLDPSLFSSALLSDEHAHGEVLVLACAVMMEREPPYDADNSSGSSNSGEGTPGAHAAPSDDDSQGGE